MTSGRRTSDDCSLGAGLPSLDATGGCLPGPNSVEIFTISQSCSGVAARACGIVLEILKDRPSWHRDCRNLEGDTKNALVTTHRTLDLTSSLDMTPIANQGSTDMSTCQTTRSVLTITFQFPFENSLAESVATMARQSKCHQLGSESCDGYISFWFEPVCRSQNVSWLARSTHFSAMDLPELHLSFRSGFVKLGFGSWGIVIERSLATSRRHFVLFS
ncbi:putative class III homeodomain-leucine zipper family [Helianthus annuus]|nr:putative class III homeodomain-leucine zipper family [Helianthus annuus]